jgi:hypothetical protein
VSDNDNHGKVLAFPQDEAAEDRTAFDKIALVPGVIAERLKGLSQEEQISELIRMVAEHEARLLAQQLTVSRLGMWMRGISDMFAKLTGAGFTFTR